MKIQFLHFNEFIDLISDQVSHRFTFFDAVANEGCGYIQQRGLYYGHIPVLSERGFFRPRTGINDEPIVLENGIVVLPPGKVPQIILPDDDQKMMIGIFFLEMKERVDRVIRFGQMKFYVQCPELRLIFNGQFHHVDPVEFMYERSAFPFHWVQWGNDEPYLLNIRMLIHGIGYDKMPDMYGIE